MRCPNCGRELEAGFLHARTLIWNKSPRGPVHPRLPEETYLARNSFSDVQPVESFFCEECGTLVLGRESALIPESSQDLCPCCSEPLSDGFLRGGIDLVWARTPHCSAGRALEDGSSRLLTNRFGAFCYPARRCARCGHVYFSAAGLSPGQVRASRLVGRLYPWLFAFCLLFAVLAVAAELSYFTLLLVMLLGLGGLRLLYAAAGRA